MNRLRLLSESRGSSDYRDDDDDDDGNDDNDDNDNNVLGELRGYGDFGRGNGYIRGFDNSCEEGVGEEEEDAEETRNIETLKYLIDSGTDRETIYIGENRNESPPINQDASLPFSNSIRRNSPRRPDLKEPFLSHSLNQMESTRSFLSVTNRRRRLSQLSKLIDASTPWQFLTWTWCIPVFILLVSGSLIFLGTICSLQDDRWFDACPGIFLPTGALFPFVAVSVAIILYQPTRRVRQQDDFYSDALLEEMLSGDNLLDVYTVTTRGSPPHESVGVVVFLCGVGGIPYSWGHQVASVIDAGFASITIQMPGSGALCAVDFSMERAERVVKLVLQNEMLAPGQDLETDAVPSKVILVGWGLSCHVAMHLASSERLGNDCLAGMVLTGQPVLPTHPLSWWMWWRSIAFRVPSFAKIASLSEFQGIDRASQRQVDLHMFNPKARADWAYDFDKRRSALLQSCADFVGPVLVIANSQSYLRRAQGIWGTGLVEPGSNVETLFLPHLLSAGFRSSPVDGHETYSRHIVDFAREALPFDSESL